jgi:hypothetical protein
MSTRLTNNVKMPLWTIDSIIIIVDLSFSFLLRGCYHGCFVPVVAKSPLVSLARHSHSAGYKPAAAHWSWDRQGRMRERKNEVPPSCRPRGSSWRRLRQGTCRDPSILPSSFPATRALALPDSTRCHPRTSGTCHRGNAPQPVLRLYSTTLQAIGCFQSRRIATGGQQEAKPRRTTKETTAWRLARRKNWKDRKARGYHVPPQKCKFLSETSSVVFRTRSNVPHALLRFPRQSPLLSKPKLSSCRLAFRL